MKSLEGRLKALENKVMIEKMYLIFVRQNTKDEDYARQLEEFRELHGEISKNATFLLMLNPYSDLEFAKLNEEQDYDKFLTSERRRCGNKNPLGWWRPLPYIKEDETPIPEIPEMTNDNTNILRLLKGE